MCIRLKEDTILGVFEYLIALCLVLDINTVWLRKDNLGDNFFTYVAIALIIIYIFMATKGILKRKDIYILLGVIIYVTVMVLNKLSVYYLVRGIIEIGLGFPLILFALKYNVDSRRKPFLQKISDIVLFVASVSLVFYITGSVLDLMPGETTATFSWGGKQIVPAYFNIYFESVKPVYFLRSIIGQKIVRNCACFLEPPMFAYVLCLSLGYEMLCKFKISVFRIIILMVTIVTSGSSTGVGTLMLVVTLYSLINTLGKNKKSIWRIIGFIVMPSVLFVMIYVMNYLLEDKMTNMIGSYNIRGDDLSACWNAFLSSPIWGIGIYNNNPIYSRFSSAVFRPTNGLSTGLLILLAQTGITMIIGLVITLIKKKYEARQYCFLFIFLFLYAVTNVPYKLMNVAYVGSILMLSRDKVGVKELYGY